MYCFHKNNKFDCGFYTILYNLIVISLCFMRYHSITFLIKRSLEGSLKEFFFLGGRGGGDSYFLGPKLLKSFNFKKNTY